MKQRKLATAYQYAVRATELAPKSSVAFENRAIIEFQLYRFDDAEKTIEKLFSLADTDSRKGTAFMCRAACLIDKGDWPRALQASEKAILYKPESAKAKANLGICYLAYKRWKEGWPLYDAIIGFDVSRQKMNYAGAADWDGSPGKTVVISEEQGIGDVISFASMIPDACKIANVIIDCDSRLENLFRRSFPKATVYGTRKMKVAPNWAADHKIDAWCSIGALGKFFRNKPEDFTGDPYLVPDPDQVTMWRALFKEAGKPVIGITWSGGVLWTGDRHRKWTLEELLPVFRSVDAVWVSLQYKDASQEIAEFREQHPEIDIRQYDYGTLTDDYDSTAAMVSALDMVFSMQTAIIHLAGALGKECWCFVNKHSQWRYGLPDETSMPWYSSVRLWKYKDGWPLEEAANELREKYAHRS